MASLTILQSFVLLSSSLLAILSPSCAVTDTVVATICGQTQNQEICEKILQSDPRTVSADLPQLSLISLNLTMKQASGNLDIFSQYVDNTTDPVTKDEYRKCVETYQQMEGIIDKAIELSQKKQYEKITELGQLMTLTYNCANGVPPELPTMAINEDMLLTSETASSVNLFIIRSY